jgi:hypothetical protein
MAEKEPHYYATDMRGRGRTVRVSDRDAYERRFSKAEGEKIVGETSPWYLYSEEAASNIYNHHPDAKILVILRDPVHLIQSLHQMNVVNTTEDRIELAEALAVEPKRREGEAIPENTWLIWDLLYTDVVQFCEQIDRYKYYFPSEKIRVVLFEKMISEADGFVEDVYRFLGVNSKFKPTMEKKNASHSVRNLGIRSLVRKSPVVSRALEIIPSKVRGAIGDFLSFFSRSVDYERTLRDSTANRLRSVLSEEVDTLNERVPYDLYSWWTFTPPSQSSDGSEGVMK